MRDREQRARARTNRIYYWACGVEATTQRPVLQGPHSTEAEARQWGFQKLEGQCSHWDVFAFNTRNREYARDMYKNKVVEQSNQLEVAMHRARYKV